jgi:hypothetical protein
MRNVTLVRQVPRHRSGGNILKPTDVTSCATVVTTCLVCGPLLSPSTVNVTLPGREVFVGAQSVPVLLVDVSCAAMTRNATRNVTLPGDRTFSLRQGDRLRH